MAPQLPQSFPRLRGIPRLAISVCFQLPQYLNPWLPGCPLDSSVLPFHHCLVPHPPPTQLPQWTPKCLGLPLEYLSVSQATSVSPRSLSVSPPYFLGCLIVSPNTLSPPTASVWFHTVSVSPPSLLFGIPPQLPWGLTSEVLVSHLPPHPCLTSPSAVSVFHTPELPQFHQGHLMCP